MILSVDVSALSSPPLLVFVLVFTLQVRRDNWGDRATLELPGYLGQRVDVDSKVC